MGIANVDEMLDDLGADQFVEWVAFERIQEDAQKRAELAAQAEAGVRSHRRGSR